MPDPRSRSLPTPAPPPAPRGRGVDAAAADSGAGGSGESRPPAQGRPSRTREEWEEIRDRVQMLIDGGLSLKHAIMEMHTSAQSLRREFPEWYSKQRMAHVGLPEAVWESRMSRIEEIVEDGASVSVGLRRVIGGHETTPFEARFPERLNRLREIVRRRRDDNRNARRDAIAESRRRLMKERRFDRTAAMATLRICGWSLRHIGELFGVSKQRVEQVVTGLVTKKDN